VNAYAAAIEDAVSKLELKPATMANYEAVTVAIAKVPADLSAYKASTAKEVTTAVEAVVYDLPAEQQATVDAYAAAIELAVANLALKTEVTVVDTDGLVMSTVFPYNNPDAETYWSATLAYVDNPTFYPTLTATVEGEQVEIPVTWACTTEYNGMTIGAEYVFKAVADEYAFADGVAEISVKIVDAAWTAKSVRQGFASNGEPVPFVIKGSADGTNYIYDATGCNILMPSVAGKAVTLEVMAGMHNTIVADGGKVLPEKSEGNTNVTVTGGAVIAEVYGGGHGKAHEGNTYVYINDATVSVEVFGGGYNGDINGDTNIYVSGDVTIGTITGGSSHSQTVSGTAYVTITDITETSTIGTIRKGTASKLVVNLDDTSAGLLDNVSNWKTDETVEVYINGVKCVPPADYTAVESAIAKIPTDLDIYTDETVQAVLDAEDAVEYGLDVTAQETVNAYAAAIEDAVSKLELKPADYTAVEEAKAKVPENLDAYTTATAQAVTDALDAVVYDLKITEQETVNAYAAAIEDAVSKLELKPATMANYDAVTAAIAKVPADLSAYKVSTAKEVTTAVEAVIYDLPSEQQATVDAYAATIELAVANLALKTEVTVVDTDGLVMSTVFPYNNPEAETYWSSILTYVENPTFYPTLTATVEGEQVEIPVTWVCTTEYDGTAINAEYVFKATADEYVFADGVAEISVEIVDAAWATKSARRAFISDGVLIHYVVKPNADGSNSIYDATGCNNLLPNNTYSTSAEIMAGLFNTVSSTGGKTAPTGSVGETGITLTGGANLAEVYGAGHGTT
ncbi:MAG: hypothetical protein II982_02680, partial [Clostridia bacterium]|nr:hypothetical protein [Clostridia bacterium]